MLSQKKEKSIEESKQKVLSLLTEHVKLKMQKRMGQVNKLHLFKKIRRNIARLKTKINESKCKQM